MIGIGQKKKFTKSETNSGSNDQGAFYGMPLFVFGLQSLNLPECFFIVTNHDFFKIIIFDGLIRCEVIIVDAWFVPFMNSATKPLVKQFSK